VPAIISAVWLRERTPRRVWTAIVLVLVGIVIVVSGSWGGGAIKGDLLAVAAITQFGVSLVILRRHPEISRMVMVGFAGIGMALVAVIPGELWGHSGETWLALVLMGAVFGPLARVTIAVAPRYLPAAEVGLFVPVETIAASLWAYLFFSEAPASTTYVGGALVLGAVLWGTWRPDQQPA
jgi:drug/metabolite transporter (DMT)-like permease